eukprot:9615564-Heterocapsa_arctica.AAC.1
MGAGGGSSRSARRVNSKWRREPAGPTNPQVPLRRQDQGLREAAASEAVGLSLGWRPQAGLAKGHGGPDSRRLQLLRLLC